MHTADDIKNLISLEQVLSSMYGLEVKSRMPCPIHRGEGLNFSIKDNSFKCFKCHEQGDIFKFVMLMNNLSFKEARRIICEYFNLSPSTYSKEEKKAYKEKLERIKQEQEEKKALKNIREYQQARICQVLRSFRTIQGDTFPEKHLESLLQQYETKPDFFITHDVHAQLKCLMYRYATRTTEQGELINLFKIYGDYADMKIIIDNREQAPYLFDKQQYNEVITAQGTLHTGDYSLAGLESLIAIERKSLDDLTGTLTTGRERFSRECERGAGLEYFALVIEASLDDIRQHKYRSKMTPQSLLQSLASFSVKYRLHIHYCGSREGGEYMTYSLLEKYLTSKQRQLETILQHDDKVQRGAKES